MANSASPASSSTGTDPSGDASPKESGRRAGGASRPSAGQPSGPKPDPKPGPPDRRPSRKPDAGPGRKPDAAPARPAARKPAKPDVEAIMADIRKTVRERADEGGLTEREFRARHLQRMLRPLAGPGISDDFADRFRSRDPSRWNIRLTRRDFHGGRSAAGRFLRRVLGPLVRLLVDLAPAAAQAARQAEINEYYRRLLWATNRDLEQARLELDLLKRELRRFGVRADFSFRAPSGDGESGASGGGPTRGGGPERPRRREGGGSERPRGDGRRKSGGRPGRPPSGRRSGGGGNRSGRGGGRSSSGSSGGSGGSGGSGRAGGSGKAGSSGKGGGTR